MKKSKYFLYSPAKRITIPPIEKTDGTIIPERVYDRPERAIYEHKRYGRLYRNTYPYPNAADVKLLVIKSLEDAILQRRAILDFYGDLFEIHEFGVGKVEIPADEEKES